MYIYIELALGQDEYSGKFYISLLTFDGYQLQISNYLKSKLGLFSYTI